MIIQHYYIIANHVVLDSGLDYYECYNIFQD